jgi:mono/diheme cytochrome c family protein
MNLRTLGSLIVLLVVAVGRLAGSETNKEGWLERVPQREHAQKSPFPNDASAVGQGHSTYRAHCAQCHGKDGQGSDRAPALLTHRVQHRATEGDLHWLLVNGNKERGMPSWSKLGDLQLWQVIRYVRSLR